MLSQSKLHHVRALSGVDNEFISPYARISSLDTRILLHHESYPLSATLCSLEKCVTGESPDIIG